MLVDEIKIHAKAGHGGDGVVRWRQEKFIDRGGPNGGDGGKGGDVYAVAVQDISLLAKYKHKKSFESADGQPGAGGSRHGKSGEDLVIDFPLGSVITSLDSGAQVSLDEIGQKVLLLKGGTGGYGNEHFKSSKNTTPKTATKGNPGEEGDFKIELHLFADLGLVGLPNAGKSSLLNSITNAHAKVGAYQFTTLDPNLGEFYKFIIADIPGLIEGASEGKGLGVKFLKHITRTKMLAHLVALDNPKPMQVYKDIRKELQSYDAELAEKDEIIVLTKSDMIDDAKKIAKVQEQFKKLGKKVFILSLYDDKLVKKFSDELVKILRKVKK